MSSRHFQRFSRKRGGNQGLEISRTASGPISVTPSPPELSDSGLMGGSRTVHKFAALLEVPVVDIEKIREISWAGIPNKYRATVWRLFLDYEPVNSAIRAATLQHKRNDYFDCVERVFSESQRHLWTNAQKQTESQILRDLPRTKITLLKNERVQLLFERVLFVWSVRHPASGYVQGMNDLLQPFFFAFLVPHLPDLEIEDIIELENLDLVPEDALREVEADCFWCFSKLLDGLQDLYTKDQPGLYKMLESLENVMDRVDPALSKAMKEQEIQYQEFAFRWMNCLLVREFSVPLLFRLWDSYLSNHSKISTTHVFVCAAMLTKLSPRLKGLSHADFVLEVQSIDPDSWTVNDIDEINAQAYVYERMFSHSPSHMRSASMPSFVL